MEEDDYKFYHTNEVNGRDVFPEVKPGQVILLKDYDERVAIFNESPLVKEKLQEFLHYHMIPTVNDLDERIGKLVFEGGNKAIVFFRDFGASDAIEQEAEYRKTASQKKKDYIFIMITPKKGMGKKLAEYLAINETDVPIIEYFHLKNQTIRYRFNGSIKEPEITKFIEDCEKGLIPRIYKTEEIPVENPGPVYKLVGKSFNDEILKNDFDILLKFYAPWCGHCKKLEPIYKKLAESMAEKNKKLKFYEVDSTKNDVEGHPIVSFPVIKLFPGKNKTNPISFDGDRTEEGISMFLKEKCSHPIVIPEFTKIPDDL